MLDPFNKSLNIFTSIAFLDKIHNFFTLEQTHMYIQVTLNSHNRPASTK